MLILIFFISLVGLSASSPISKAISLGSYNIAPNSITVSGISSGAVMATQMHVAYSSIINGAGMFAGVPYGCALGLVAQSLTCMSTPGIISMVGLYTHVDSYQALGYIDPLSNLSGDKVFIFQGTADSVVSPGNGDNLESFYNHYRATPFQHNMDAQHCQPTLNYGGTCNRLNTDNYMNRCNYDGSYEMLQYLYGGLTRPAGNEAILSNLYEFDQSEFFQISAPSQSSMDNIGMVYVPTRCASGTQCKLHVAFHGCQQGRQEIGNVYVVNGGYLEVAERNNIIVLFPQAIKSTLLGNPQGCWDWWGYNNNLYDTKSGNQVLAVKRMIDRLTGK